MSNVVFINYSCNVNKVQGQLASLNNNGCDSVCSYVKWKCQAKTTPKRFI